MELVANKLYRWLLKEPLMSFTDKSCHNFAKDIPITRNSGLLLVLEVYLDEFSYSLIHAKMLYEDQILYTVFDPQYLEQYLKEV